MSSSNNTEELQFGNALEEKLAHKVQELEQKLQELLRQQIQEEQIEDRKDRKKQNTQRRIQHQSIQISDDNHLKTSFHIRDRGQEKDLGLSLEQDKLNEELGIKKFESNEIDLQKSNKALEFCLEAHCLMYGHGIEPNIEDALLWYDRSATLNEPQAMIALGNIYQEGIGIRVDTNKGLEYYLKAIEVGDPYAYYKIGKMYEQGGEQLINKGLPDANIAYQYYQKSAIGKCKEGMRELGYIYEKGGLLEGGQRGSFKKLVEIDLEKAFQHYHEASQMGDELATNYLGSYYYNNKKDYYKAVQCFRQASERGTCERALNNLGLCFEQGIGGAEQDYNQAIKLYEQSAKLGYNEALINMAYLYFKIAKQEKKFKDLEPQDLYFECANLLRLALAKDEKLPDANFLLAKLYEEGLAIDQNIALAYKYYKKATEQNFAKAYTKLGHFYYSGLNNDETLLPNGEFILKQSILDAVEYYSKAASLQDSEACNCLGLIYENGNQAIQPNLSKAMQFYKLAIDYNSENSDALLNLGLLKFNDQNEQIQREGLSLIRSAMNLGNIRAKEFLINNDLLAQQNNFMKQSILVKDVDEINDRDSF